MTHVALAMLLALQAGERPSADSLPPRLPGLGTYTRETSIRSAEARAYFDQGWALWWAFNHGEAVRSFEAAARLEPGAPMPHVAIALAHGPYVDRRRSPALDAAARRALAAARARIGSASAGEHEWIELLELRYDSTRSSAAGDSAYVDRLRALHASRPDDADIATLLGEALMLRRGRSWWTATHAPAEGIPEARSALEKAIAAAPAHLGANHLYVHLFEAAHDPRPALGAADRLAAAAPGAGHLQHMGSHVWFRVGRYDDAARANERAWAADREYFRIARPAPTSVYVAGYHPHTLHFLWMAHAMAGRASDALRVADSLAARVNPTAADASNYTHPWVAAPILARVRFGDWAGVLAAPAPAANRPYVRAMWHHARALALAATGSPTMARVELDSLVAIDARFPANAAVAPTAPGRGLLLLARLSAESRIAEAERRGEDAIPPLERAVQAQDSLGHMEPPGWYVPLRQSLGAALLRLDRAADAERVFRAELEHYPDNGWSLSGLAEALRRQGRVAEARTVAAALARAWPQDAPLRWWER